MYEQTHVLDAWEHSSSFGEIVIEDEWLGEQTPYEVTVDVEETGRESYATGEFLEMAGSTDDFDCFEITVVIDSDFIDFRPAARETCQN